MNIYFNNAIVHETVVTLGLTQSYDMSNGRCSNPESGYSFRLSVFKLLLLVKLLDLLSSIHGVFLRK